jgi:hypothetical protein
MGPFACSEPVVKETLKDWFMRSGELFVELYLPHSGGGGHFYVLTDYWQYEELMAKAKPGSISFVLRDCQLPVRGHVCDELIAQAVKCVGEGSYYLIVKPGLYPTPLTVLADGSTHTALTLDLEKLRGTQVWIGTDFQMPDQYWHENTGEDALIATKPSE